MRWFKHLLWLVFPLLLIAGRLPAAETPVWSLEQCLNLASEHNLEIRSAAAGGDLAAESEGYARAARKPVVAASSDVGWVSDVMHIDMPGTELPGAGITIPGREITVGGRDSYDLALSVSYPVDIGGKLRAGVDAAGSDLDAARSSSSAVENRTIFAVTRAWLDILKAGLRLRTAETAREQVAAHLVDVGNYHAQGMLPENELLRTELELSRIEVIILEAKQMVRLGKVALLTLLDEDLLTEFDIPDDPPVGPVRVLGAVEPGTEPNRPESDELSFRIESARSSIHAARAEGRPRLALFGSSNYGKPGVDRFRNKWMGYLRLGLRADFSVWDGGRVASGVASREHSLRLLELNRDKLARTIEADIIRTGLNLETAGRRHQLNLQALDQAAENFRMVESRFKQGLVSNTDYLDAQTSLTRARLEAASAEVDLLVARADTRRALGAFRD